MTGTLILHKKPRRLVRPHISRYLSSNPIRMPKRSYFQPGGVFRALHLIPLRCTAHAQTALPFHSFSRYTLLNWINQSERTRKKWRANHCARFQEQLIRSRVCWRIIGIKDWPIRGKGLKELTNQRKPGRLFKGMFWWKNQLLGGVPLGLQTLSSRVTSSLSCTPLPRLQEVRIVHKELLSLLDWVIPLTYRSAILIAGSVQSKSE